jgi:Domain of unknown function (DUF5916)/Carbohydrate family 9 binding domain-like
MNRLAFIAVLSASSPVLAQAATQRARAVRRTGSIAIDGSLGEQAWQDAPKHEGFTQRFPTDGATAMLATRFAVAYDDDAIYVGVWCDDPDPKSIRRLLTRRDVDANADTVVVAIDSYHDRRTGYFFQLNAAGVQRDMQLYDDSKADDTWDAVWAGSVSVNDRGWTAEFRIPLSQLRFSASDAHEWGFQLLRNVARTKEQTAWAPWPRTGDEMVSRFGIVDGIDHVKPGRRLELLPYVTGGFEAMPVDAADPLNDQVTARGNAGIDIKYGIGSAFTLSAAINPNFGQVEADPSRVNLSANELFLAEKRTFFLEGSDLFRFPLGPNDSNVEGAFYSRRIGAAPSVQVSDYEYVDKPRETTLYGAAKLSGKTPGGWSVGLLEAVTAEENATTVDRMGVEAQPVVAPLTNYAVGRVKRDFREGRTSVGLTGTAVHRALADTGLEETFHDQAYSLGASLQHRWSKNAWLADVRVLSSYVHGSEAAIERTQKLQHHLYQRPDAPHIELDPGRTSLAGSGAAWRIGRFGDTKHWRFMFGGDLRTPGLEVNDVGFQVQGDRAAPFWLVEYHDEEPGKDVLNWSASAEYFLLYDQISRDPRLAAQGLEWTANVQLENYWQLGTYGNAARNIWAAGALRGGPGLRAENRANGSAWFNTDTRRRLWVNFRAYGSRTPGDDSIDGGLDLGINVQARANVDLYLGPSISVRSNSMQYVGESADMIGTPHYVTARIRQKQLGLTMRVNWTFSPKLSLQAYAQPFIASGRYSDFKDVDNPRAPAFRDRFDLLQEGNLTLSEDGDSYIATNNGRTFEFDRPDFDFRQLRSTVVMRWEYRPGSSIFAIWSHGRTSTSDDGRVRLRHDLAGLLDARGENVVMVKANYWIGL